MATIYKHMDRWSLAVILLTLVLFILAPIVHGITHELLLEAGVFLVSVKLILMTYKNGVHADKLEAQLTEILATLRASENRKGGPAA